MNSSHSSNLRRGLRIAAVIFLAGGLVLWAASGARIGWTQTSTVTLQRDEITGIDYPVRQAGFVAGVEVPLVGAAAALALAGLSFLPRRRVAVRA